MEIFLLTNEVGGRGPSAPPPTVGVSPAFGSQVPHGNLHFVKDIMLEIGVHECD